MGFLGRLAILRMRGNRFRVTGAISNGEISNTRDF